MLIEIRDQYGLNLSFDDQALSAYTITLNQHFNSPEIAFQTILKGIPVGLEKSGSVYLFFPEEDIQKESKLFRLSGRIKDAENNESLPYSNLSINNSGCITDEKGNFNFKSSTDSLFHLIISHLGYPVHDTILHAGFNHQIALNPSEINLTEVLVVGNPMSFSQQTGTRAGLLRINHKLALLIPGNGDNSVFNLLRLQPGIMAAGEQSSEMIIWGSYAGQSQVNFDNLTLFGLKNYNDNISAVNPYMTKDIRVHKGGFDARYGERVGGIVDITGVDGNSQKSGFNFNLNNMTMNLKAQTPVGKHNSLVGAYRQTYYNLYSPEDLSLNTSNQNHFAGNTIVVNPDYQFRDANLKFSGRKENGDSYHISSFYGQDHFNYSVEQSHRKSIIEQNYTEKNRQYGTNANYNFIWEGLGNTAIDLAYSSLHSNLADVQKSSGMMMNHNMHSKNQLVQNNIDELKANISGKVRWHPKHEIDYGSGLIRNAIFLEETYDEESGNTSENSAQLMAYLQDRISLLKLMELTLGMRTDYSLTVQKNYLQPRISMAVHPSPNVQLNASWGIYNQFIVLSSEVDPFENYRYLWRISDGNKIPVLHSQHLVAGGIFKENGFSISLESFYKATKGITRFIPKDGHSTLYQGNSINKGVDFFMKQEFKGHKVWVSYSLSQALEWFPFFEDTQYQNALHDQRHEFKLAGILNFSPFIVSANYVYGSGYTQTANLTNNTKYPYHRVDCAGIYRFRYGKFKMETGLSILNVFNYQNIKYSNITQIPTEGETTVNIYSEAVPFTPSIFLNITF